MSLSVVSAPAGPARPQPARPGERVRFESTPRSLPRPAAIVHCALLAGIAAFGATAAAAPPHLTAPFLSFDVGVGPRYVALGDVNGDGRMDLATADDDGYTVSLLLGLGDGSFASRAGVEFSGAPEPILIRDVNGDGFADLLVGTSGWSTSRVSVRLGHGDGTFQPEAQYTTGRITRSIAAGDLNGDGNLDLAVACSNDGLGGGDGLVTVLLGAGDGSFSSRTDHVSGLITCSVALGLLNNDSWLDIVATNHNSGTVSVWLGGGGGSFPMKVNYAAGSGPRSVGLGDFNGDGRPDLAVVCDGPDQVEVMLNNGDGTFASPANFETAGDPYFVTVNDLDADGDLDLAVATTALDDDGVSVLLGDGYGGFGTRAEFLTGSQPWSLASADLNGDGKIDLVTGNHAASTASVLLGNGDGTFGCPRFCSTGDGPMSLATGDVNKDGRPDLAVANKGSSTVSVMWSAGDGSLLPRGNYSVGYYPVSVVLTDLNQDTCLDLAAANWHSETVSVGLGRPDGYFQSRVNYKAGPEPAFLSAGDLNGDGIQDLVVANSGSDSVSVLLGKGDGTLHPRVSCAAGTSPSGLAIGEVTGDGHLDLLVAHGWSSNVRVLPGNGDGTFGSGTTLSVFGTCLTLGDLSGDGLLDLAVGDSQSDSVRVLLGAGNGTFQIATSLRTGMGPYSIAIADMNGDGNPDLIVGNEGSYQASCRTVSVLPGNGDGTFGAKTDFGAARTPAAVAVVDLNGDASPDVVVADNTGNRVAVLLDQSQCTAVRVLSLSAVREPGGILVQWALAYEAYEVSQVMLYRSDLLAPSGRAWVAALQTPAGSYMDASAPADEVRYWLETVDRTGGVELFGPISVSPDGMLAPWSAGVPCPNPFRQGTRVSLRLPVATTILATVHDVMGRQVARLLSGPLPDGDHEIAWDGRDYRGQRAPDGAYFIRIESPFGKLVRKVVVSGRR